jgi:hypothetical protein
MPRPLRNRFVHLDLKQGLSAGVKEEVEDQPLVLQSERGQFARQSCT